ncbi:hypothetical protein B0T20DRAFT_484267 [Sordaria brevicollis]|uniref:Uncharacterized protein n=1 Tax=Sordaria brevicollis TaxID=83679 RepID=A0AAE0NVV3_SORBR|nr:hypothetical protein B0T20DRAFT_484267 [Sordaria brevicollis]
MAGRLSLFGLLLAWVSTLLTRVTAIEPGKPAFVFPFYDSQNKGDISEFYLEDVIIATYVNCDDLTNFQCWCGDDISRSLDGDGMWKILEGVGYLGPNASQAVVLKKLGKDIDFQFTCGFGLSTTTDALPWSGSMFRLQNKPRPGGPRTFGLEQAIEPTRTFSNYQPFRTFAGDSSWKDFNEITGPIEASFVDLNSPAPTSTTSSTPSSTNPSISSATSSDSTPQSTASTPSSAGAAAPSSSETGTSSSVGQDPSPNKGGLSTGAKAGIGAGGGVAAIAIVVLAFLLWRQRKRRSAAGTAASNTTGVEGGRREEVQEKGTGHFSPGPVSPVSSGFPRSPASPELGGDTHFYRNTLDSETIAGMKEKSHGLGPETERYELGGGGGGWHGRAELP